MNMKEKMAIPRTAMPAQPADRRVKNFDEVALGYTPEMAVLEAQRCIMCKNKPCVAGCPVSIDIPGFIDRIVKEDFEGAYQVLRQDTALPAVCGRVCPQETQCEEVCTRGIKGESVAIGRLERFAADWHMENTHKQAQVPPSNGIKVAVVGSGPSGLTCAGEMRKMGYEVTVFEALHKAGGVLVYGIPEFRLPKAIVQQEVDGLKAIGVDIQLNHLVGRTIMVDELFEEGYQAVYLASGAGLPKFMGIPGESLKGVYSANEYLTRVNLMKAYEKDSHTPIMESRRVAVVGGGNVAMDAARSARRLGADVYVIYRRSRQELPARLEEVEHAEEEGIVFHFLHNPTRILGDEQGWVTGVECVRMELGEPDASGRRRPVVVEGSETLLPIDTLIMALGTSANPLLHMTTPGLDANKWGGIITDEPTGKTSREGVYAGGDVVTGSATVILAMGAGKAAAKAMDEYIKGENGVEASREKNPEV